MENQSLNEKPIEDFENEGNRIAHFVNHEYHKYICEICNYIYDEADGDPNIDLAPGILWENISNDWRCPECSALKSSFKFLE